LVGGRRLDLDLVAGAVVVLRGAAEDTGVEYTAGL